MIKAYLVGRDRLSSARFAKIPRVFWFVWTILCLTGALSSNPLYTLLSLLFIPLLIKLLWRIGEPPILFFGALYQWLSITIKVFYADFNGLVFNDPRLHEFYQHIDEAFLLSLLALFFFVLGIHLVIRTIPSVKTEELKNLVRGYNTRRAIIIYILFSFVSSFVLSKIWFIPGLAQFFSQITNFKWGLLFLLCLLVINKNEYKKTLFVIFAFDVVLGFASYFSQFKDSIIFFVITIFTLWPKIKLRQGILIIVLIILLLNFSVLWTYRKGEYRTYLSDGEVTQEMRVSKIDALKKFLDIARTIDSEKYHEAFERLIFRISYIDLFSACIDYVPQYVAHQDGKVWGEALLHVVTPRILFPDKPVLDDSSHTNQYTGLNVAGVYEATSIGVGYIADSYIDFGKVFLWVPMCILGFLVAFIYKFLLTRTTNLIWGNVLVIPLFYFTSLVEMSAIKITGALCTYLVTVFVFARFFIPHLEKILKSKRPSGNHS